MAIATQIQLDPAYSDLLRTQAGNPADEVAQQSLDLMAQSLMMERRRQAFAR